MLIFLLLIPFTHTNAQNNTSSFAGSELADTSSDLTVSGNTFSFDIDVSVLDNASATPWEGIQYADLTGVWFHFSSGTNFVPGQSFGFGQQA